MDELDVGQYNYHLFLRSFTDLIQEHEVTRLLESMFNRMKCRIYLLQIIHATPSRSRVMDSPPSKNRKVEDLPFFHELKDMIQEERHEEFVENLTSFVFDVIKRESIEEESGCVRDEAQTVLEEERKIAIERLESMLPVPEKKIRDEMLVLWDAGTCIMPDALDYSTVIRNIIRTAKLETDIQYNISKFRVYYDHSKEMLCPATVDKMKVEEGLEVIDVFSKKRNSERKIADDLLWLTRGPDGSAVLLLSGNEYFASIMWKLKGTDNLKLYLTVPSIKISKNLYNSADCVWRWNSVSEGEKTDNELLKFEFSDYVLLKSDSQMEEGNQFDILKDQTIYMLTIAQQGSIKMSDFNKNKLGRNFTQHFEE